jgi:hypothetical protein
MTPLRSNNELHQPVICALKLIKRYAGTKLRSFPSDENVPLDFVPPLWREAVVGEDPDGKSRVDRIAYEITVLNALRDQLRCKEVWVAGADRYRNPDDGRTTDFEERRDAYYEAPQRHRTMERCQLLRLLRKARRTRQQSIRRSRTEYALSPPPPKLHGLHQYPDAPTRSRPFALDQTPDGRRPSRPNSPDLGTCQPLRALRA